MTTAETYTHKTITLPSNTIAHNWTTTNSNPDSSPPRAILILQHGFGEYAERYTASHARLIPALTERNIDVWALDLEGHGRSPGEKGRGVVDVEGAVRNHVWLCGHVAGIYSDGRGDRGDGGGIEEGTGAATTTTTKQSTEDTPSFTKFDPSANAKVKNKHPHPPIFLFGHSLGGLVTTGSATALLATNYSPTANSPSAPITIITGLMLTSPVFPLPGLTITERLKSLIMHLLARPLAYLFPSREVPWSASADGTLCGDAEEERRAAEDKIMFHGQISWTVAATAAGVVRGVWRGIRQGLWGSGFGIGDGHGNGGDVDVLVLHGRKDSWADWRGSLRFVEGVRKSRGGRAAGGSVSVPLPEGEEDEEESGAKLVILESPYHELLNVGGNEGQEALRMVIQWIEERIER